MLIHWELIPRGELIRSEQKKRARRRPILDLRHAPVVQLNADALSVTLSSTGYGLFVGFFAENHVQSSTVVDDDSYKLKNVD
jgi:hypothetical protein